MKPEQLSAQINELLHKIKDETKTLFLEEERLINEEKTGNYDFTLSHNLHNYQPTGVK